MGAAFYSNRQRACRTEPDTPAIDPGGLAVIVGKRSYRCLPSRNKAMALSMRRWRVSALFAALMLSTWYRRMLLESAPKNALDAILAFLSPA